MNQRKAKRLRQALRLSGVAVGEKVYQNWNPPVFAPIKDPSTGIVLDYKKVSNGIPCKLTTSSGRRIYQVSKALLKRGELATPWSTQGGD